MTTPDPTLNSAILGAVARTRVEADLPAAILAAIRETHEVIERERWNPILAFCRAYDQLGDALEYRVRQEVVTDRPDVVAAIDAAWDAIHSGDLEP